jgi:hypothetical protein
MTPALRYRVIDERNSRFQVSAKVLFLTRNLQLATRNGKLHRSRH